MSLIKFITGPIRGKTGALILGTRGVGILGTALQIQTFGLSISTLCMALVVQTELGVSQKNNDSKRKKEVLDVSLIIQLMGAAVVIFIGIIAQKLILGPIFGDPEVTVYQLLPVLFSIPLVGIVSCYFLPLLYSMDRYDLYAKVAARNAIIDVSFYAIFSYLFGFKGTLWSLFASPFIWCLQLTYYTRSMRPSFRTINWSFDRVLAKKILRHSVSLVLAGILTYGSNLVLRGLIAHRLGEDHNGYYQVLLIFSAYYLPFITSGVWAQLMPKLARSHSGAEFWREWASFITLAAWCGVAIEVCLLVAPETLVSIFFSKSFLPAQKALPWQFLGDFFFLLLQPCAAFFYSRSLYRTSAVCTFLGSATLVIFCWLMISKVGLTAVPLAYAAGNLAMFLFLFVFIIISAKSEFNFYRLTLRLILPLCFLGTQIAIYFLAPQIFRVTVPLLLGISALFFWKNERLRKTLLYVR